MQAAEVIVLPPQIRSRHGDGRDERKKKLSANDKDKQRQSKEKKSHHSSKHKSKSHHATDGTAAEKKSKRKDKAAQATH